MEATAHHFSHATLCNYYSKQLSWNKSEPQLNGRRYSSKTFIVLYLLSQICFLICTFSIAKCSILCDLFLRSKWLLHALIFKRLQYCKCKNIVTLMILNDLPSSNVNISYKQQCEGFTGLIMRPSSYPCKLL